jgi:hypothetical protein
MYINESFANVKKQQIKTTTFENHSILPLLYLLPKVLDSDRPSYCHDNYADHSCLVSSGGILDYADHSCLVSSGGILDEDICHGPHDMVCDDRFGNCMADEPNFPP